MSRLDRLAQALGERGVQAALVSRAVNVRYLSGLASSNAAMLVRSDATVVLVTDARYAEAAAGLPLLDGPRPQARLAVDRDPIGFLVGLAGQEQAFALAMEYHDLTLATAGTLEREHPWLADRRVDLGSLVEEMRRAKDPAEQALLARASALSVQALHEVLGDGLLGRSERDVAAVLEHRMRQLGADGVAFDSIVASGPNGAVPHHQPGDRVIGDGDLVTIDFGAQVGGYAADCTRTIGVGALRPWQREIYAVVARAQAAGLAAAQEEASLQAADDAARAVISQAGYGEAFVHGVGHGVGLEVHEPPMVRAGARGVATLDPGTCFTIEPGIYLPGQGGVRIEDTVLAGDRGTPVRLLTRPDGVAPDELVVVHG